MRAVGLLGRATGRLGYIWPAIGHAIEGTAQLALRNSIIPATTAGPNSSAEYYWQDGAVGRWTPLPLPPGQQDLLGTTVQTEQRADYAGVIPRQARGYLHQGPALPAVAGVRRRHPRQDVQTFLMDLRSQEGVDRR
jgi:hypothetical protein